MILVDNRTGSKELYTLFPRGLAELTHLEYADFAFIGHYADGDVAVGIERKRIGDFVNSMCTGRLSGRQLTGMLNSYHHTYLVLEGMFRANPTNGVLEVWSRDNTDSDTRKAKGTWHEYRAGRRRFMARDIWAYMNTLQVICGVHCYHCSTKGDTVHYIRALYHWWMKEYGEHKSHILTYSNSDTVRLLKQSVVGRVAGQLDGVGWEKARALEKRFGTVAELVAASEGELMEVEGIGKVIAMGIKKQLGGKE